MKKLERYLGSAEAPIPNGSIHLESRIHLRRPSCYYASMKEWFKDADSDHDLDAYIPITCSDRSEHEMCPRVLSHVTSTHTAIATPDIKPLSMASKQPQQTQQQQQLAKQKAAEAEAEKVKEYIAKRVLFLPAQRVVLIISPF